MSQSGNEADRIERDLERTRARLDGRLTELQERLSPGQVIYDMLGYFRSGEGVDFGRSLLQSARANPMPAAVTGIGLAWLMTAGSRPPAAPAVPSRSAGVRVSSRSYVFDDGGHDAMTERLRFAEQGVTRDQDEAEHSYTARLDEARGQAIGLARHAQESTESFGRRIRDVLAAAAESVSGGAHDLRDQAGSAAAAAGSAAAAMGSAAGSFGTGAAGAVGSAAGSLGSGMKVGAQSVGSAAQGSAQWAGGALLQGGKAAGQTGSSLFAAVVDSPVLLGALGVAAGALLGALLPQAEQEEAALGGIAGQARDAARSLAQQATDGGTHVAHAVMDAGRDSAQAHGLLGGKSVGQLVDAALSGDLAGDVKQAATEVLDASDKAVRKELPEQSPPAS